MKNKDLTSVEIGGKDIYFPAQIEQIIEFHGLYIVRIYPNDDELDIYPQENLNRNVYAYNEIGELVWQIDEVPHGDKGGDKAYMNLWIENKDLIASNWVGLDYRVNLDNGSIGVYRENVRPW